MRAALAQALFIEPDILLLVGPLLALKSQPLERCLLFGHPLVGCKVLLAESLLQSLREGQFEE